LEDVRSHAEESVSIVLVGNQVDLCQDEEEDEEDQDSEELEGSDETEGQEEGQKQKQKQRTVEEGIAETSKPKKKSKLKKRQVSTKEAREFAEKEGIMFVETSAKTGQVSLLSFQPFSLACSLFLSTYSTLISFAPFLLLAIRM